MTHRTLFPPPDENRALEQLERLHREIQRARRDRERAGTEFDGFVQEIRNRPADAVPTRTGEPASRRVPRPVVPSTERAAAAESTKPSAAAAAGSVAPRSLDRAAAQAKAPEHAEHGDVIPALAAPRREARPVLLIAAVLMLVGAVVAFVLWQRSLQPSAGQPVAPTATATSAAPAPAAPAPAPAQPAPAAATPQPTPTAPSVSPSTVQVTTARAVWMRVIVDGQKVLERELPAGQLLTYTPTSAVVIRAGDAGGVRVKVGDGPEQVLGRDAFPATRRFEVPKP